MPAIAITSARIHYKLLRLLFLYAHRETTHYFDILDELAQTDAATFIYRRAALLEAWQRTGLELKSKTRLAR